MIIDMMLKLGSISFSIINKGNHHALDSIYCQLKALSFRDDALSPAGGDVAHSRHDFQAGIELSLQIMSW